jgi:putative membrane protein
MISDRRGVRRRLLRVAVLSALAAVAVVGPVGAAQAHVGQLAADGGGYGTDPTAAAQAPTGSGAAQDPGGAVSLDTQDAQALTAVDIDFVRRVRLAGLWEIPASQMAMTKGVEPRVRQIGQMISAQHVQLNAIDEVAAKKLGVTLPTVPTGEQQRWLGEMQGASGSKFDQIYVDRLRAAHGKIFAAIAVVRASTTNDVVRTLAIQANGFVLNHMSYLESTGLVQYAELPKVVAPATAVVAAAAARSANGGIAVPLIWLILAVALVAGAISTSRMIRPRSFGGGRHSDEPRPVLTEPVVAPRPRLVTGDDDDYDYPSPYPRPRPRMRSTL